jgi:hypothetical protein
MRDIQSRRQKAFRIIAGTMIFASALLGYIHSPYWLFLTMFVGLNMLQYAFTDWCLMVKMLEKAIK